MHRRLALALFCVAIVSGGGLLTVARASSCPATFNATCTAGTTTAGNGTDATLVVRVIVDGTGDGDNATNEAEPTAVVTSWGHNNTDDSRRAIAACMNHLLVAIEDKRESNHILHHVNPPLQRQPLVADYVVDLGPGDLRTYRATQLPLFVRGAKRVAEPDDPVTRDNLDTAFATKLYFWSLGLLHLNRQPPVYLKLDPAKFEACRDTVNVTGVVNRTLPLLLFSLPAYVTSSFGGEVGRTHYFLYQLSDDGEDHGGCWQRNTGGSSDAATLVLADCATAASHDDNAFITLAVFWALVIGLAVAGLVFPFVHGPVLMALAKAFVPTQLWVQRDGSKPDPPCCSWGGLGLAGVWVLSIALATGLSLVVLDDPPKPTWKYIST